MRNPMIGDTTLAIHRMKYSAAYSMGREFFFVLRTAGGFGAHQKVKWCAAKQQMVRSKSSSDGWGKDQ